MIGKKIYKDNIDLNDDKKSLSSTNNSYDNKDEFMEDTQDYVCSIIPAYIRL